MSTLRTMTLGCCAAVLIGAAPHTHASYAFYVGKNLSEDGGVMLGGTGEEVSSHWLEIVPAADHPDGATVSVGVTEAASIPGELIDIPQVSRTHRYMQMAYSDYEGFPAPLTNGGVNEHRVAVRDVWAPNRTELVEMTPTPQRGPQYSDLARIVLERATSAREGVEIIGDLIAEHGYSTYGGNTHLIGDPNEGWVVWEFAGGQGLWAAKRLGPDDVYVLYPGYIEDFPSDYRDNPDFMGSDNLISFAEEQGWYESGGGDPFNVFTVYGLQDGREARTGGYKYMTQAQLEQATRDMAPVSEADLMERVRDPRIADDEAGYGQVVSLHGDTAPDLIRMWVAPTGSVTTPFNLWWLGVQEVPMEYGQHRYLTKDAASRFLNPDYQLQEASDFVGRRFKQVMYYTCAEPETLLPMVTELVTGFEEATRTDVGWVERSAHALIDSDEREDAQALLTYFANSRAMDALALGDTLVDSLAARAELVTGRHRPEGDQINDSGEGDETVHCLTDGNPDQPMRTAETD